MDVLLAIEKIYVLIKQSYMSPQVCYLLEFKMVILLCACSPIPFKSHVCLVIVLGATSNHIPLR